MKGLQERQDILIDVSLQMLEAVQALHSTGLVHQDIKPDNFRVHEGYVKIIDLGLVMEYKNGEEHKSQGYFGF